MIPSIVPGRIANLDRTDRLSYDLRMYLRQEWAMETPRLLLPRRTSRGPIGARLRAWFHGRLRRPRVETPDPGRETGNPGVAADGGGPKEDCTHELTEELGGSGLTTFLRCTLCGGVLVGQEGRWWKLHPSASTANVTEKLRRTEEIPLECP